MPWFEEQAWSAIKIASVFDKLSRFLKHCSWSNRGAGGDWRILPEKSNSEGDVYLTLADSGSLTCRSKSMTLRFPHIIRITKCPNSSSSLLLILAVTSDGMPTQVTIKKDGTLTL